MLINSGFCGSVRKQLDIGHLIIANRLAYRDREIQLENSPIENIVDLLVESEFYVGKVQTFNWPVLSRARVAEDTLAVDMESFAIALTAAKYQIPVIIMKAVSDIVPKQATLISLLNQVRILIIDSQNTRACLSRNVKKIIEYQTLAG